MKICKPTLYISLQCDKNYGLTFEGTTQDTQKIAPYMRRFLNPFPNWIYRESAKIFWTNDHDLILNACFEFLRFINNQSIFDVEIGLEIV